MQRNPSDTGSILGTLKRVGTAFFSKPDHNHVFQDPERQKLYEQTDGDETIHQINVMLDDPEAKAPLMPGQRRELVAQSEYNKRERSPENEVKAAKRDIPIAKSFDANSSSVGRAGKIAHTCKFFLTVTAHCINDHFGPDPAAPTTPIISPKTPMVKKPK
jgi:hypothetical protein